MNRSTPAIALAFCLVTSVAFGQTDDQGPPNLVAMTDQEAATSLYEQHLVFLAHPSLAGRLPGHEGCGVAETMIATTFRQLGLLSPETLSNFRQSFQFNQGSRFGDLSQTEVVTGNNMCAVLPGSGALATEWVILGAHHDHIGLGAFGSRSVPGEIHEGADDNASGTSAVLLAAQLLSDVFSEDDTERRSILFITFSGEESGLNGSRHYVNQPLVPLSSTSAMINLDMIGRLVDDEVLVTGIASGSTFEDMIEGIDVDSPLTIKTAESLSSRSDHASFYDKGVPVLFFSETVFPDEYHTPDDESSRIDFESGANAAILAAEMARRLSIAPVAPEFQRIEGTDNSSDGPSFSQIKIRFGIKPGNYGDLEPGIVVSGVSAGTSAEDGGIETGDIMIRWNNRVIEDVRAWMGMMAEHEPGDIVQVTVLRDQAEITLPIMLKAKSAPASVPQQ